MADVLLGEFEQKVTKATKLGKRRWHEFDMLLDTNASQISATSIHEEREMLVIRYGGNFRLFGIPNHLKFTPSSI